MSCTVNSVLEDIAVLEIDEQIFINEVIQKRIVEAKRQQIADDFSLAKQEETQGILSSGSVDDLFNSLELFII